MSKVCVICEKRPLSGRKYKRRGMERRKGGAGSKIVGKTLRKFYPNLQKLKLIIKGTVTRAYVCTKCIKANKIVKA
jgi:large subunit ribosomal protein L28